MKPAVLQKTAQVTVLMLIISVLLPVLAFAATSFKNVTFNNNGTITGTVYTNVYDGVAADVYANVYLYSPDGKQIGNVVKATYNNVFDGVYRSYSFSVTAGTYDYVKLKTFDATVGESVYSTVYREKSPGSSSGGGSYSGGGSSSSASMDISADGYVHANSLELSLYNNAVVTLNLKGDFAELPASALDGFTGKTIIVKNASGSYHLPVGALKLEDLAKSVSTTTNDLLIRVSITAASKAITDSVYSSANTLGANVVVKPVDFSLAAVGKDKKTAAFSINGYVTRTLPITSTVDATETTGVLVDTTTGKLSFVPTVLYSTYAELKRNGDSVYALISLDKSFNDISGHWAQSNIELLANKLVVDGTSATTFEPERSITRAEFAALVVRSLGIQPLTGSSSFSDVTSSDWHASTVNAAVYAKLIDGYEDGTFRPSETINREEVAAIVIRALNYAGTKSDVTAAEQSQLLAKFTDSSSIVWAQEEIAAAIDAGIIDGITDSTIGARETATRAQAATMLKRLLTTAKFIN